MAFRKNTLYIMNKSLKNYLSTKKSIDLYLKRSRASFRHVWIRLYGIGTSFVGKMVLLLKS